MKRELGEYFEVKGEPKQGCVTLPWLFKIFLGFLVKKVTEKAIKIR